MDNRETLLEKKKIDILKSINANLTGINKRLDEISKTLSNTGFAVLPTMEITAETEEKED